MRILFILFLLFTFSFSKECYFNKVRNVCFYKYFDRDSIYKVKANEEYYVTQKGSIYTFDNIIEVRFNSIGAIFTIINDLELEFVDKKNNKLYLFKVNDRRDLFPTISKLNRLDTIMIAEPYKKRKFTNTYVQRKIAAKKARLKAVMEKTEKSKKTESSQTTTNQNIGFGLGEEEEPKEKKSFLKGNL